MLFLRFFPRLAHLVPISLERCVYLLTALLLISCSSGDAGISRTMPPPTTTVNTVISHAATGPTPVTTPLAPPPSNCVLKPPPQQQHLDHLGMNSNVHLVGGGPFWIYSNYYPGVLHLAQSGSQQWPMTKMVVEVGPNNDQPVTLRLRSMQTGTLAWWTDGQTPPAVATSTLVLNPQKDPGDVGAVPGLPDIPHGSLDAGWKEWGIFPLFSIAGCYLLEVSWSGGSWQSSFAVGN